MTEETKKQRELSAVYAVETRPGVYISRSGDGGTSTEPRLWVKLHDADRKAKRCSGRVVQFRLTNTSDGLARDTRLRNALLALAEIVPVGQLRDALTASQEPTPADDPLVSVIDQLLVESGLVE